MIIKTILFFTILSIIIGNNKFVQSSELLRKYLSLDGNDIDKLHINCQHAVYLYVYKSSYEYTNEKAKLYIKQVQNKQNAVQVMRIARYLTILHYVYYSGDGSHFIFFRYFQSWQKKVNGYNEEGLKTLAAKLVNEGVKRKVFVALDLSDIKNLEYIKNTFFHCEKTYVLFSEQKIFLEKTFKHQLVVENEYTFPNTVKYGYILLLLKEQEISEYKSLINTVNGEKMFIMGIMKDVMLNIYDAMVNILYNINISSNSRLEFIRILMENINIKVTWKIFISMHLEVYQTSKKLFETNVGESTINNKKLKNFQKLHSLDIEVNHTIFVNKVQAQIYYWCSEGNRESDNGKNESTEDDSINGEINRSNEKRLIIIDEYGDYKIRVPIINYYSIILDKIPEEPIITQLIKNDKTINFLMELRLWMVVIQKYAQMMNDENNDDPLLDIL